MTTHAQIYPIYRNKRPPQNNRPPKTVIFQRGEYTKPMVLGGFCFSKGGGGEYTKPMAFDGFWNVFSLFLKIKRRGAFISANTVTVKETEEMMIIKLKIPKTWQDPVTRRQPTAQWPRIDPQCETNRVNHHRARLNLLNLALGVVRRGKSKGNNNHKIFNNRSHCTESQQNSLNDVKRGLIGDFSKS